MLSLSAHTQNIFPGETDVYGAQIDPITLRSAAYALDAHTDEARRASDYLRVVMPQRYQSVAFDPEALKEEESKVRKELAKFQKQWRQGQIVEMRLPAGLSALEGNIAYLSHDMVSGLYSVGLNYGSMQTPYLPPAYELMMANVDISKSFELTEQQRNALQARIDDKNFAAFLSLELQIDKVTQHRFLHGSIRKIRWYSDLNRTELFAEKREKRDSRKLVQARLLTEGITLDAVPEHGFDVNGMRLMETLVQEGSFAQSCKDQARLKGHRVLECRLERRTEPTRNDQVRYLIVGGRIAKASFYGTGEPSDMDWSSLWEMVKREHGGPQMRVMEAMSEWYLNENNFKLYPDVFAKGKDDQPYYVVESKAYLDLKAGKPGTEVMP